VQVVGLPNRVEDAVCMGAGGRVDEGERTGREGKAEDGGGGTEKHFGCWRVETLRMRKLMVVVYGLKFGVKSMATSLFAKALRTGTHPGGDEKRESHVGFPKPLLLCC
jgi:hypothetical protein